MFLALAIGAGPMIVGGVAEIAFGVKAERRSLEASCPTAHRSRDSRQKSCGTRWRSNRVTDEQASHRRLITIGGSDLDEAGLRA